MTPVVLTGDPVAQAAVRSRLVDIAERRRIPLEILSGLKTREMAYAVNGIGAEIWHCGPFAPDRALLGCVHRVVPGLLPQDIAFQAAQCLDEFLRKHHFTGENS
jgi:hypothetical protein